MQYANNKGAGADQSAHLCSLISTFFVRCLDNVIPVPTLAKLSEIHSKLSSEAEQAVFYNPED